MTGARTGGVGTHMVMLLNVSLVSTSFPVGAAITNALEPAALNCVRFAIAAAVFAVLLTAMRAWRRPSWRDGLRYLILAAALVGFFTAMFAALRLTSAINTAALFTLVPLFSALIAWPMLGQRTPPRQIAFMLLAALGALWVVFRGSLDNALALRLGHGDLIFLAGCVAMAAFAPLTRRLDVGENLMSQMFWTLLVGTLLLGLIGATDLAATDWRAVPDTAWAGIAYLAVFTSAVTFTLLNYASLRLSAAKVMSYNYLIPALVLLLDAVRSGGVPSTTILVGAGLSALATLLLQISPAAQSKQEAR